MQKLKVVLDTNASKSSGMPKRRRGADRAAGGAGDDSQEKAMAVLRNFQQEEDSKAVAQQKYCMQSLPRLPCTEVALPRLQAAPAYRPIDLCSDGGVLSFLEQIARYITAESYADRADALKLWLDRIQCTGQDDPAFKRSEAVQLAEIFLQTAPPFSEFQNLGSFSRKKKMVSCFRTALEKERQNPGVLTKAVERVMGLSSPSCEDSDSDEI